MGEKLLEHDGKAVLLKQESTVGTAAASRAHEGALSMKEQADFDRCEEIVRRGWRTFFDVGRALAKIRDGKLYRVEFPTFASYCRERWFFGRSHAYRLIATTEMLDFLSSDKATQIPTHESHVRPLLGLPRDKIVSVWRSVVQKAGDGIVTAKLVNESVVESLRDVEPAPALNPPRQRRSFARHMSRGHHGTTRLFDEVLADAESRLSSLELLTQSDMVSYVSDIDSTAVGVPMQRITDIIRRWDCIKRRLYRARAMSPKTKK